MENIKIIPMAVEVFTPQDAAEALRLIERMGRLCYGSPMSGTEDGRDAFISRLIRNGHESVLEHVTFSAVLTIPRAISHQIVRHRIGVAYSQQSQRFVDLSKGPLEVIEPTPKIPDEALPAWRKAVEAAASAYGELIRAGCKPQVARSVLPNCAATKLGITANLRAWRHILRERFLNPQADPAVREVMGIVKNYLVDFYHPVFYDMEKEI